MRGCERKRASPLAATSRPSRVSRAGKSPSAAALAIALMTPLASSWQQNAPTDAGHEARASHGTRPATRRGDSKGGRRRRRGGDQTQRGAAAHFGRDVAADAQALVRSLPYSMVSKGVQEQVTAAAVRLIHAERSGKGDGKGGVRTDAGKGTGKATGKGPGKALGKGIRKSAGQTARKGGGKGAHAFKGSLRRGERAPGKLTARKPAVRRPVLKASKRRRRRGPASSARTTSSSPEPARESTSSPRAQMDTEAALDEELAAYFGRTSI